MSDHSKKKRHRKQAKKAKARLLGKAIEKDGHHQREQKRRDTT